jgi:hypothetical protein
MAKYSATDFTDPLVQTLGVLSNYTPFVEVYHKDTYGSIMEAMGIKSLDEFGWQDDKQTKPWVVKWIGWAFRNARVPSNGDPALTVSMGRGRWALTPEGVDHARRIAAITEERVLDDHEEENELDEIVREVTSFVSFASLVKAYETNKYVPTLRARADSEYLASILTLRDALTQKGFKVFPEKLDFETLGETATNDPKFAEISPFGKISDLGSGVPVPVTSSDLEYHPDPYIVVLAIDKTPCFGSFKARSTVCGSCPLQRVCLNKVRSNLAEIAKGFESRLTRGLPLIEEPEPEPKIQAPVRDPAWDLHNRDSSAVNAGSETVCYRCGKMIHKGEKAQWHRTAGLYHDGCK